MLIDMNLLFNHNKSRISCYVIFTLCLCFHLTRVVDGLKFVKAKSSDVKQVGDHTKNVVFDWEYIVEPGDTIQSVRIGYYQAGKQFTFAFKKKGQAVIINDESGGTSPKDLENIIVDVDDVSVAKLTLKQVISTIDNNRKFFCLIKHGTGRLLSEVMLKVYVPPVFTKKSAPFTKVTEGSTLTLQCQATAEPAPIIKWEFTNKTKTVPYNSATGLLALKARRTDTGNFTCSATNVGGTISYSVRVEVQYPPEIDLKKSTKIIGTYVSNPKAIYLECVAHGVPPPKYVWNNPQGLDVQTTSHVLVLQDPEITDIGKYTCRASNDVGHAKHTIEVIGIKIPAKVILEETALSSRSARFNIKLPTDLGNGVLKGVKLSYHALNGNIMKEVLSFDQTMFELRDLKPFTQYEVNVTVKNEYFESQGQKYNFITTEDKPGPPTNITMVGTVSSMEVTWSPPKEVNGILVNYYYIFSKTTHMGNSTEVKIDPTITTKVFNNLDFYTQYTFKIKAATEVGTGDWAPVIRKYTDPNAPTEPRNITVTIESSNFIGVRWKPPANLGGGQITKYDVKIKMVSKENPNIVSKSTSPYLFNAPFDQKRFYRFRLVPYVKVDLWIREGGGDKPIWGGYGGPVSFEMPEGAPTPPLNVKVLGVTPNQIHISWRRPIQINGQLQNFTVEFNKKGDNVKRRRYVTLQLDNTTFYHTIKRLDTSSEYRINVFAYSRGAMSDPSNMVAAKTTKSQIVSQSPATADDNSTNIVPIIGGVVAFVFLMLVGVVLFLYLSRRRSRLKSASSSSSQAGFTKLSETDGKIGLNGLTRSNQNLFVSDFGSESGKTSHRLFNLIRQIQLTSLKNYISQQSSNNNKGFIDEFRSIKAEGDFTFDVSTKPENKVKNRYANILAYDHSRVVLNTVENLDSSDYINANYVDGYDKTSKFIATQGPVAAAFGDFWRMVWEQNTTTIVMITNLIEKGRTKCQKYWPNDGEPEQEYGNIKVLTLDENELADYIIRRFTITLMKNGSEVSSRKISQYQFISWPDHGCPQFPSQLLQFIKRIRSLPQNGGPIVLHCSAGVGRTGTYMTIDAMLDQIEKEQVIDVFGYVTHIRGQRNLLVQTEPQYIFIYKTVLESISCGNTEIHAMDLPSKIKHLNAINPGTTLTYMQEEYQRLSTNLEKCDDFEAANLQCNVVKNRFPDIIPYESTRVKLWPYPEIDGSDYINASFLDGYQQREAYILTQAPQQNTIQDFWRMLWEYEVFSIVMISSADERDMHHCYPYWPVNNEPAMFGLLRVQISEEEEKNDYVKRLFRVTNTKSGEHRTISHFMYFDWPVDGAPQSPSVIEMIGQLQKTQQSTGNSCIVIHCSNGSGRSGAFAALMYCIERVKLEGLVDVFQTVRTMRTHRVSVIQSLEQYQFIYMAVCNYLDCFSNYANFK